MVIKVFGLALKNLQKRRLRSFLCILSVSIAIFSVVFILNIGSVGESAVNTELEKSGLGGLLLYCPDNNTIAPYILDSILNENGVKEASGVIMDKPSIKGYKNSNTVLWAINNGAEDLISLEATKGRFFNKSDNAMCQTVCMIDENIASDLFGTQDPVGKTIPLKFGDNSYTFTIIGVVKAGGGIMQNFTAFLPAMVFIPQQTYTSITGRSAYTQIAVKLDKNVNSDQVKLTLQRKLAVQQDDIQIENLAKQKDNLTWVVKIISIIVASIGGISVLVSGIGIMTMMLMSVNERRREIGIKKALGAHKFHIMSEYLFEAILIMLTGFVFGCGIALASVFLLSKTFNTDFTVPLQSIAFCFAGTVLCGLLFGGYPAYKAAGVQPAVAIKGE